MLEVTVWPPCHVLRKPSCRPAGKIHADTSRCGGVRALLILHADVLRQKNNSMVPYVVHKPRR